MTITAKMWYRQPAAGDMTNSGFSKGFLAVLFCVALAIDVQAKEIEGVRFADEIRAGAATLRLNEVGLLRYRYVIKAYVAALYLGEGARLNDVLADEAKRLEIEYFYAIEAPGFVNATIAGIAANVSPEMLAKLRPRIDRLNTFYRNVKPGDRYALTYLPGVGTELALNGTTLGTVEGADFAAAVFAIWLGPQAIDESLKTQLLGRS